MVHTVREIMTTEVITLDEADNLLDIEEGMEHLKLRHLPVVDGKKLVGLLTHRDILRLSAGIHDAADLQKRAWDAEGTFVAAVMTRDVKTVAPDTPIITAAQSMIEGRFGCLPVVNKKKELLGIVTEHDLLKFLVGQLAAEEGAAPAAPATEPAAAPAEEKATEEPAKKKASKKKASK